MAEHAGWVETRSGAVYSSLQLPPGVPRATSVVVVPPFGWHGVSAARNLRGWARDLVGSGYPTLRYHPPGEGDSAGRGTDHDVASWCAALADLVEQLRTATRCESVTAIGLGLGGLVALQAASDGAALDDLVLWATPARGRSLLRELRAFAALSALGPPVPLDQVTAEDGTLWINGHPLSAAAQEQLVRLDSASLDLSRVRRALVLGRGGLSPDARLVDALRSAGADVTAAAGPGYDDLTVEPRISQRPRAAEALVAGWLRPDERPMSTAPLPLASKTEQRLTVGSTDSVVTHAANAVLTAVFLGAGAVPRSGPNRLWTDTARRWAGRGVSSVRVDLHGIGEAPGEDVFPQGPETLYDSSYRREIAGVLDAAEALGLPARFLLVGLCSGGFWAMDTALGDRRVVAAAALNSLLIWPPPLLAAGSRHYLVSARTWRRFLADPRLRQEVAARVRKSVQLAARHAGRSSGGPELPREVLASLHAMGTLVAIGALPGEHVLRDLERTREGTGTMVRVFDGPKGAHTLATPSLRRQSGQFLDEVLAELLSRPAADAVQVRSPAVPD